MMDYGFLAVEIGEFLWVLGDEDWCILVGF